MIDQTERGCAHRAMSADGPRGECFSCVVMERDELRKQANRHADASKTWSKRAHELKQQLDNLEDRRAVAVAQCDRLRAEHDELSSLHAHSVGFWEPRLHEVRSRLTAATTVIQALLDDDECVVETDATRAAKDFLGIPRPLTTLEKFQRAERHLQPASSDAFGVWLTPDDAAVFFGLENLDGSSRRLEEHPCSECADGLHAGHVHKSRCQHRCAELGTHRHCLVCR